MKLLAFDIETAQKAPNDSTDSYAIGITCAATITEEDDPRLWHGAEQADGRLAARMTAQECRDLAQYLVEMNAEGYTVASINGLGFDLRVLAEEAQDLVTFDNLRDLALDHIDPPFQLLCQRGFMMGMAALAAGAGVTGKLDGMDGLAAIEAWKDTRQDQDLVLEYVAQDARATLQICQEIDRTGFIRWRNRHGQMKSHFARRLLTVRQALAQPLPDTSWMSDPWPRSRFAGWLEDKANLGVDA